MMNNDDFIIYLQGSRFAFDKENAIYYVDGKNLVLDSLYLSGFRSSYFDSCENLSILNSVLVDSFVFGDMRGSCVFENVLFYKCSLNKLFFEGAIKGCRFVECSFHEAMLNGNEVDDCLFYKCDFSGVGFSHCKISNTDFIHSDAYNSTSFVDNQERNVNWVL
jgi:uncharacterized protein YjbI with pentapeptide repeats